jgi:hypothetical protein
MARSTHIGSYPARSEIWDFHDVDSTNPGLDRPRGDGHGHQGQEVELGRALNTEEGIAVHREACLEEAQDDQFLLGFLAADGRSPRTTSVRRRIWLSSRSCVAAAFGTRVRESRMTCVRHRFRVAPRNAGRRHLTHRTVSVR